MYSLCALEQAHRKISSSPLTVRFNQSEKHHVRAVLKKSPKKISKKNLFILITTGWHCWKSNAKFSISNLAVTYPFVSKETLSFASKSCDHMFSKWLEGGSSFSRPTTINPVDTRPKSRFKSQHVIEEQVHTGPRENSLHTKKKCPNSVNI